MLSNNMIHLYLLAVHFFLCWSFLSANDFYFWFISFLIDEILCAFDSKVASYEFGSNDVDNDVGGYNIVL